MSINNKRCSKKIAVLAALVIAGLIGFVANKINTVEDNIQNNVVSEYLVCKATNIDRYVLLDGDNENVDYEARMMFLDSRLYRVSFIVSKEFLDKSSTNMFTTELTVAYNNYVGEKDISKKSIVNTVTNIDNIGKMVISIEGDDLNDRVAPLAMLDNAVVGADVSKVQEHYERVGYTCSIDRQDVVLSE